MWLLVSNAQAEAWRLRDCWPEEAKGPPAQEAARAARVVGAEGDRPGGSRAGEGPGQVRGQGSGTRG